MKTKQKCQKCNKLVRSDHLIWFKRLHLCNDCKLKESVIIPGKSKKVAPQPFKTAEKAIGGKR